MRTRTRAAEATGSVWFRAWTVIGAAFLSLAMAVLLASCGEEADAGGEAAGGDSANFAYGDYDEWDADGSGGLDEAEFNEGVYTSWDADDSGTVEEGEFETGVDNYYEDYNYSKYGGYDEWDANNDGEISQGEFDETVVDTGLYSDWDVNDDDQIAEDEFSEQTA